MKKSEYVGDHGGAYTDIDGNRKQFTYIDHDPKVKISVDVLEYNKNWEKTFREETISEIIDISPSLCPIEFQHYTSRDGSGINWNLNMIKDSGVPIWSLRDLRTILKNRMETKGYF